VLRVKGGQPIRLDSRIGEPPMPEPASARQISCGSIVAQRAAPTSLKRASTVARQDLAEVRFVRRDIRPLTVKNPGDVSTMVVGLKPPLSIAAAITSGLKLEPGSKISVIARFR
jgi:hypothetical protein